MYMIRKGQVKNTTTYLEQVKMIENLFGIIKRKDISLHSHIALIKSSIMADIKERVVAIIVDKLGVDEAEVTVEASFTNDLGADSLDTVELIMEFEKEFNIAIPDDQAENIATVGEAIKYIQEHVS